jgi:hypothetical protein
LKIPTAGSLPPPNSTVTQQSSGAAQTQSSSQPPPHLPSLLIRLQTLILMQRLDTPVAGLVSGSSSVAPLLSIPTVVIDLYDDLSFHDPSTTFNEGMSSFIARSICKYRESNELLSLTRPFALTYQPHIFLDHIAYVLNNAVVY